MESEAAMLDAGVLRHERGKYFGRPRDHFLGEIRKNFTEHLEQGHSVTTGDLCDCVCFERRVHFFLLLFGVLACRNKKKRFCSPSQ
jgi:hypothetical protein